MEAWETELEARDLSATTEMEILWNCRTFRVSTSTLINPRRACIGLTEAHSRKESWTLVIKYSKDNHILTPPGFLNDSLLWEEVETDISGSKVYSTIRDTRGNANIYPAFRTRDFRFLDCFDRIGSIFTIFSITRRTHAEWHWLQKQGNENYDNGEGLQYHLFHNLIRYHTWVCEWTQK